VGHHQEVAIDPAVVETGEVTRVGLVVAGEIIAEATIKIATDIKYIEIYCK
jgi:hypothetical protein